MRIRMNIRASSTPWGTLEAGQEYELPDEKAQAYLNGGLASPVLQARPEAKAVEAKPAKKRAKKRAAKKRTS